MKASITITELRNIGTSDDGETSWIMFKQLGKSGNVIFWGSPENGYRNIDSLKHQKLPVMIEIETVEDCSSTENVKSKYNASLSISEHTWVQINPEY